MHLVPAFKPRFIFYKEWRGTKQVSKNRPDNRELSESEIVDYVTERFKNVMTSGRIKNLVSFQAMNKYLIMSKDQTKLKVMGNVVARYKRGMMDDILSEYREHLEEVLPKSPTVGTHCNVMMHVFGHFSRYLGHDEKNTFLDLVESYREGKISIGMALSRINPTIYRFNNTYLANQTYFLLYSNCVFSEKI